jgi:hypothetical protein
LACLIGIFATGWIMSLMGAEVDNAVTQSGGGMAAEAAAAEVEGAMAMGTGIIIGAIVFVLILSLLTLFGAIKMFAMKKSGFILYAIGGGIWALLCLIGGEWVYGLGGVAFIVLYGMNLKHMS